MLHLLGYLDIKRRQVKDGVIMGLEPKAGGAEIIIFILWGRGKTNLQSLLSARGLDTGL